MKRPALSVDQVAQIRASDLTDTFWAQEFGVNRSTVERARKGQTHSDNPQAARLQRPPKGGWKKKDLACKFDADAISLPGEQWRPVVGWERVYRVSDLGRIYSLHQTGRLTIGMRVRGGYRIMKMRDGDRRAYLPVHCMVLEAFIGPRPERYQGCHGRKGVTDNGLSNLRWDTVKANQADRLIDGTHNRGSRSVSAILTEDLVAKIRSSPEVTAAEWAKRLGVSRGCIDSARRGKTWVDVARRQAIGITTGSMS